MGPQIGRHGVRVVFTPASTDWRPGSLEASIPIDDDVEGWLDLLRDSFMRDLREAHEYPEPPPFHDVFELAADHPVPEGKFPRNALGMQLKMLTRTRGDEQLLSV